MTTSSSSRPPPPAPFSTLGPSPRRHRRRSRFLPPSSSSSSLLVAAAAAMVLVPRASANLRASSSLIPPQAPTTSTNTTSFLNRHQPPPPHQHDHGRDEEGAWSPRTGGSVTIDGGLAAAADGGRQADQMLSILHHLRKVENELVFLSPRQLAKAPALTQLTSSCLDALGPASLLLPSLTTTPYLQKLQQQQQRLLASGHHHHDHHGGQQQQQHSPLVVPPPHAHLRGAHHLPPPDAPPPSVTLDLSRLTSTRLALEALVNLDVDALWSISPPQPPSPPSPFASSPRPVPPEPLLWSPSLPPACQEVVQAAKDLHSGQGQGGMMMGKFHRWVEPATEYTPMKRCMAYREKKGAAAVGGGEEVRSLGVCADFPPTGPSQEPMAFTGMLWNLGNVPLCQFNIRVHRLNPLVSPPPSSSSSSSMPGLMDLRAEVFLPHALLPNTTFNVHVPFGADFPPGHQWSMSVLLDYRACHEAMPPSDQPHQHIHQQQEEGEGRAASSWRRRHGYDDGSDDDDRADASNDEWMSEEEKKWQQQQQQQQPVMDVIPSSTSTSTSRRTLAASDGTGSSGMKGQPEEEEEEEGGKGRGRRKGGRRATMRRGKEKGQQQQHRTRVKKDPTSSVTIISGGRHLTA